MGNKIIWTKFGSVGNNWDQYVFDSDYVYHFITGTPTNFWAPPNETQVHYAPRYPYLGYPGTRLVEHCNQYLYVNQCVPGTTQAGANLVEEVSGPYAVSLGGNVGDVGIVKVDYYWNCSGDFSVTCTEWEENWYAKPFGWVRWAAYHKPYQYGSDWALVAGPSVFNQLVAGAPGYTDWCIQ